MRSEEKSIRRGTFKASGDDIYIATIGYKKYLENKESERLQAETKKNSYNAAWG